jgi:hypothetical protein
MVSGSSLKAYWVAHYLVDFGTHALTGIVAKLCIL